MITSEIGGASIAQNVEGRKRFPIAVRYERDFRDNPESSSRALIPTPSGHKFQSIMWRGHISREGPP